MMMKINRHQILSPALGGKTCKLKFGRRGDNLPVKNMDAGIIEIRFAIPV